MTELNGPGARIRSARLAAGIAQTDLAASAEISPAYLNLIEHGRRRVSRAVLNRLSNRLGVSVARLTDGPPSDLVAALRSAAGPGGETAVSAVEFAERMPAWAELLATLAERVRSLEHKGEALANRAARDPDVSAALHELATSVTSILASSSILVESEGLDPDWQARFNRNIHADSERLAQSSQALAAHLAREGDAPMMRPSGRTAIETLLEASGWDSAALAPPQEREGATVARWRRRFERDRAALPEPCLATHLSGRLDPVRIAHAEGCGVDQVLRRLALRGAGDRPVGLLAVDGAGAILLSRPIEGFDLPRVGSACALWPCFAALNSPGRPVRQVIEMPGAVPRRFTCWAVATTTLTGGAGAPTVSEATMLILGDGREEPGLWPVGSSCQICPRRTCPARREAAILDSMEDV